MRAVHHLLICERTLVEPLGDITTTAITRRDATGLARFWAINRLRFTGYDQIRVARDERSFAALQACLARLERSPFAANPHAHALLVEAKWLAPVDRVSRPAQRALAARIARLDRLLVSQAPGAPEALVAREVIGMRCALAALDRCDLHAQLAAAAHGSYAMLMEACCVIGADGDHGLGTLIAHTLATGKPLFVSPYITASAVPPAELAARVVASKGAYSAAAANALFAEDAAAVCGEYVAAPTWASGAALQEAASYAAAIARTSEPRIAAALARAGDHLVEAARADHVVLEWLA
jgi:hypothetical protein